MNDDTWNGMYEYKGFTIWAPSEKEWIAEPSWSIRAIENYKSSNACITHSTIAKAKKWIDKIGITLLESDYL